MKKILIAGGEPDLIAELQTVLTPEGYAILTAASAMKTQAYIKQERLDLIILDETVHNIRNFKTFAMLKKNLSGLPISILIFTRQSADRDVSHGLPIDAILTKPFNPLELVCFVKHILASSV